MCNKLSFQKGAAYCEPCGDRNSNCCNTGHIHGAKNNGLFQYCHDTVCDYKNDLMCREPCGEENSKCCDTHRPGGRCPFEKDGQRLSCMTDAHHSSTCNPCGKNGQPTCDTKGSECDVDVYKMLYHPECRSLPSPWPTCKSEWKCGNGLTCTFDPGEALHKALQNISPKDACNGLDPQVELDGKPWEQPCMFGGCRKNQEKNGTCKMTCDGKHEESSHAPAP